MSHRIRLALVAAACMLALTTSVRSQPCGVQNPGNPFTPGATYRDTFFVTPNGPVTLSAPMVKKMLGAGDAGFGGGQFAKVGIQVGLHYSRHTEGIADDWKFYVTRGPLPFWLPLPPDVMNLSELPAVVHYGPDLCPGTADDLPILDATLSRMPPVIAALEWARYHDLPLTIQMLGTGHHGGAGDTLEVSGVDLDRHIEEMGRDQCSWDVSDFCDPDNDPLTYENAGISWASFSFATPTMADPVLAETMGYTLPYQGMLKRNLQMGIEQLLTIASHPRYEGRIVAIAIDPEVHYPAHQSCSQFNPCVPYLIPDNPSGTIDRPFVEDYHPVMIRAFQIYEEKRYGDATPIDDTNGDGVTFWGDFGGDYLASGWAQLQGQTFHPHSQPPQSWLDVDPPRNWPRTSAAPRSAYWHEWINFRVEECDRFIEKLVAWAVEAGFPPDRVFTHQTHAGSSYNENRASGGTDNLEWLDDWMHIEASGGVGGVSLYQPGNLVDSKSYYPNLWQREGTWGAPEFNPYVKGTGFATQSETHTAVHDAWTWGAHVLWPQAWGDVAVPAFDRVTTAWGRDTVDWSLVGWSEVNYQKLGTGSLQALTSGSSYLESPVLDVDAGEYPFLIVKLQAKLNSGPLSNGLRCDFHPTAFPIGGSAWPTVCEPDLLRHLTKGPQWFVLDMSQHPQWWGTITQLRLFATPAAGDSLYIESAALARANFLTTELQSLMAAKKDTARPIRVPTAFAPPLPIDIGSSIAAANAAGNLAIYGTDPIGTSYADFGMANNFFSAAATSGGVTALNAVVQPAATYLGMRKTGKFLRLAIPDVPDLHLSLAIGIEDGYTSTDGARFRVVVRDEGRVLHELFDREWRWNHWSERVYLSLDAFRGQEIDLAFEVHGIAKNQGDQALWHSPRIEQVVVHPLTVSASGSGSVSPDFPADYPVGTNVVLQAFEAPGSIFTGWTTSGTPGDIANASAPTTMITMWGPHTVTAHFDVIMTTTVESIGVEDGWVEESTQTSGIGGTMDSLGADNAALKVGDTALNHQWKTILSFDTAAIPDGAVILSARLTLVRGSQRAAPFTTHGLLGADAVAGVFGTSAALELADFASSPPGLIAGVTTLPDPLVNGGTSQGDFSPAGLAAINLVGRTQVRIAFALGDDNDAAIDGTTFHAGGDPTPANRPTLEVSWY